MTLVMKISMCMRHLLVLTSTGLKLDEAHLEPCIFLLVRMQLPLPLLHVRRRLLQR